MAILPLYSIMGSLSFPFNYVLRHIVNEPIIENVVDRVKPD